ncbi:MAG: hypothetical protein R3Y12_05340 [Clostridia bacterium]
MAKISFKEFYDGEKYGVQGYAVGEYAKIDRDDLNSLLVITTGYAIKEFIKLIKNGDFISEFETEMKSFYVCESECDDEKS